MACASLWFNTMADIMASLRETMKRHNERMLTDPHYRDMVTHFEALNEAWKKDAKARQSHYDAHGYCDNPGRGF